MDRHAVITLAAVWRSLLCFEDRLDLLLSIKTNKQLTDSIKLVNFGSPSV